jgi:hypothetical protein
MVGRYDCERNAEWASSRIIRTIAPSVMKLEWVSIDRESQSKGTYDWASLPNTSSVIMITSCTDVGRGLPLSFRSPHTRCLIPKERACSASWRRRAAYGVIAMEIPLHSTRRGPKIAIDFPEPVGKTAMTLSGLPLRTESSKRR